MNGRTTPVAMSELETLLAIESASRDVDADIRKRGKVGPRSRSARRLREVLRGVANAPKARK